MEQFIYNETTIDNETTTDTETITDNESIESDFMYYDESDEIYETEQHLQRDETNEEINGKYFIGCYKYIPRENILLFVNRIHPHTFMKYNEENISNYFFHYSGIPMVKKPSLEILKLHILPDNTHIAIVKTYYIRIIQRCWKKVFKNREQYRYYRMGLNTIRDCEIGKRPTKYSNPGINGMLQNHFTK